MLIEQLKDLDLSVFMEINSWHNSYFDTFMYIFSSKMIWIPMYASILYVLCKNFSFKTVILSSLLFALLITLADQSCSSLLRPFFERLRPSRNPEIAEYVHIVNDKRGGMYGFPSCHASNTFALAFFCMFLFKNIRLTIFLLFWAVLTCYSRVYLGVHYPGDLIVGSIVGFISAVIIYKIYQFALKIKYFHKDRENLIYNQQSLGYVNTIMYVGIITILVIATIMVIAITFGVTIFNYIK